MQYWARVRSPFISRQCGLNRHRFLAAGSSFRGAIYASQQGNANVDQERYCHDPPHADANTEIHYDQRHDKDQRDISSEGRRKTEARNPVGADSRLHQFSTAYRGPTYVRRRTINEKQSTMTRV